MTSRSLESIAHKALGFLRNHQTIDTRAVAIANQLLLVPHPHHGEEARLDKRGVIYFDPNKPHRFQQAVIGREIARWCLRHAPDDAAIPYVQRAIQLPREAFMEDCCATGRDLAELATRYPNVLPEIVAARFCDLHKAVATVYYRGRVVKRIISPGWSGAPPRPTRQEILRGSSPSYIVVYGGI